MLVGLPTSDPVPCMTLPWQIAQKMHACTDPVGEPRTNDRAHDLVDLQLFEALMGEEPLGEARSACAAVFAHVANTTGGHRRRISALGTDLRARTRRAG